MRDNHSDNPPGLLKESYSLDQFEGFVHARYVLFHLAIAQPRAPYLYRGERQDKNGGMEFRQQRLS